ncbi:putative bifunctional diguanylate cyclase/phosphodiesterase [Leeia sp.]|uniref:putative bifunctional diguanylate cyclase/phosphodiesterase n=1 Tax=Leeia sp. TaxID=2884678 RepID=UPI0035ADF3E7
MHLLQTVLPEQGWAWYVCGDFWLQRQAVAEPAQWPESLSLRELAEVCGQRHAGRWTTGWAEQPLGYLVVPGVESGDGVMQMVALRLGDLLQREQLRRTRRTQRALFQIAHLSSSEREPGRFLQQTHQIIRELMYVENFFVSLCDNDHKRIRFPYYADLVDVDHIPAPDEWESIDGEVVSLTGAVLSRGQVLSLTRAELNRALQAGELRCIGQPPEYWLGVPVHDGEGTVFGAVVTQSYLPEQVLSSEDRALFLAVAQHIGLGLDRILHRANLEEQVAARTVELSSLNQQLQLEVEERQRAEHLQSVLLTIAEISSRRGRLDDFYAELHKALQQLLHADNCYVALYDRETDLISFPYYVDGDNPVPADRHPGNGLTECVIERGSPILLSQADIMTLREQGAVKSRRLDEQEPQSWLGAPLLDGDQVCGVLAVQSYDARHCYVPRDMELLSFVSAHIANAVTRRQAAAALDSAYQELENRVQQRTQELDEVNARLRYDNLHDTLTGLPNRSHLLSRIEQSLASKARFAVMFIDLDRFKVINDSMGHLAGDQLLIAAAQRLRECLRTEDLLARLGGDEFAVLAPDAPAKAAEKLAQRIVEMFDRPFTLMGQSVFTSCSIGIVTTDVQHRQTASDLLRDADIAMYQAKANGRDGYVLFSRMLRRKVSGQVETETALRRALKETSQLIPYYQPIADLDNGQVVALEALIRWRRGPDNILSPAAFLLEAEGSRLIGRIDLYMLEQVCRWLASHEARDCPPVHVNCSSYSMSRSELVDEVMALLHRYHVPPERIQLELTESALLADPDLAARTLDRLRANGIKVVLDDFGTGFSSLSYLHRFHFDALKIDRSFVLDVLNKPQSEAIIRTIVRLAETLGLDLVAEGVEDVAVLQRLKDIGVSKIQGYVLDRPVPAQDIQLAIWLERLRGFLQKATPKL